MFELGMSNLAKANLTSALSMIKFLSGSDKCRKTINYQNKINIINKIFNMKKNNSN